MRTLLKFTKRGSNFVASLNGWELCLCTKKTQSMLGLPRSCKQFTISIGTDSTRHRKQHRAWFMGTGTGVRPCGVVIDDFESCSTLYGWTFRYLARHFNLFNGFRNSHDFVLYFHVTSHK